MSDNDRVTVARDLREIVRMYGDLGRQAYYAAVSHDAADIEAINLLGPVADAALWEYAYERAEALSIEQSQTFADYAADQVSEWHPLWVLAFWEDAIRAELGTSDAAPRKATVSSAAAYLRASITWMFDTDSNGDMRFIAVDQLMSDLARCRSMLEGVLKDGTRPETGVPCMTCRRALVKVYGTTEDDDRWHCTRCKAWSTEDQYRLAVRHEYMRNADRLTLADMHEQYRIPRSTIYAWAAAGRVRKRGRDDSGRYLYDVADCVAMRDEQHASA